MFLGYVYVFYFWGGCMFVSGLVDKTVRFWDFRVFIVIIVVFSFIGTYNLFIVYCRFFLFIRVLNFMI